jgi:hypothetical protein
MIELARHRMEVLIADTVTETQRDIRRITAAERTDLIQLLIELHRLNLVVSEQRKTIERRLTANKRPNRKRVAARSQPATTRSTTQIANKTKAKS